jgi:hypothetical protein
VTNDDNTGHPNSIPICFQLEQSSKSVPDRSPFRRGLRSSFFAHLVVMNDARLQKSLRLLRDVNYARTYGPQDLIEKCAAKLQQHDWDARDKIDTRQLTIFDALDNK